MEPQDIQTPAALVNEVRKAIESACDGADGRHLAMRVVLRLDAMLHPTLSRSKATLQDEIAGLFAQFEDHVTLENTEFYVRPPPAKIAPGSAQDAIASLDTYFAQAALDPAFVGTLRDNLQPVLSKRKSSDGVSTLLERLVNDELEAAIADAANELRTRLRTLS